MVQRGGAVQYPGARVLSRAEVALPACSRAPLPPAGPLRLLPLISRLHHHSRQSSCFTSALHQVSNLKLFIVIGYCNIVEENK